MIIDIQKKLLAENQAQQEEKSIWGKKSEHDSTQRLHQFQNRLQDLDRRIMELR
jgi:ribosomal protein S25